MEIKKASVVKCNGQPRKNDSESIIFAGRQGKANINKDWIDFIDRVDTLPPPSNNK